MSVSVVKDFNLDLVTQLSVVTLAPRVVGGGGEILQLCRGVHEGVEEEKVAGANRIMEIVLILHNPWIYWIFWVALVRNNLCPMSFLFDK